MIEILTINIKYEIYISSYRLCINDDDICIMTFIFHIHATMNIYVYAKFNSNTFL